MAQINKIEKFIYVYQINKPLSLLV